MNRKERKFIRIGYGIGTAFIIASVAVMVSPRVSAKNADLTASAVEDEYFTDEPTETDLRGILCGQSGMPCEDPEQFRKWMETYEPQTSEEETTSDLRGYDEDSADAEIPQEVLGEDWCETEAETQATEEVVRGAGCETPKTFSVNGETLNPDLQSYLYQRLADRNIEWFMPYAIMIAYQESHFDCTAVNPHNGIDCGLFQFRAPYYEGQDIFNPYEQIDIFTEQMANRESQGCDVYEMISRHHQSDYGAYSHEYVSAVMQHENNLREVK